MFGLWRNPSPSLTRHTNERMCHVSIYTPKLSLESPTRNSLDISNLAHILSGGLKPLPFTGHFPASLVIRILHFPMSAIGVIVLREYPMEVASTQGFHTRTQILFSLPAPHPTNSINDSTAALGRQDALHD